MNFIPFQNSGVIGKIVFFLISAEKILKSCRELYTNKSNENNQETEKEDKENNNNDKEEQPKKTTQTKTIVDKLESAFNTKPIETNKLSHSIIRLCLLILLLLVFYNFML